MRVLLTLLVVLIAGCSSKVIRCEGQLTPINSPAADKTPSDSTRPP